MVKLVRKTPAKLQILLVSAVLLFMGIGSNPLNGQETSKNPYHLLLELGGPAGIGSINVERQFWRYKNLQIKGRAGLFVLPHGSLTKVANSYFYPLGVTLLWGEKHQFEFGAGGLVTYNNDGFLEGTTQNDKWGAYGHAFLGYRLQLGKGSWFLMGGYVPLYHPNMNSASGPPLTRITGNWAHWASVGIGINI